jgi:predicted site-specific integrase-resolvase
LRGIRNLFSVSHATAQRYKDGIIKDAVSQNGRKIIVDREKALELFQQKSGKGFTK